MNIHDYFLGRETNSLINFYGNYDDNEYEIELDDFNFPSSFYNNLPKNDLSTKIKNNAISLEYLLSMNQITKSSSNTKEENKNKFLIDELLKKNINNLKEDIIYYFSSPESLLNFKSNLDEENKYYFYKDFDSQNFIAAQKEKFDIILSVSKSDVDSKIKISKLSNFNNSFCSKVSIIKENELLHGKMVNLNKIEIKIDECSFLYSHQEIDEEKIINYLNELKDVLFINIIDMESLGYLQFNLLEKNLILILKLI